ncbi:MAG: hypothetical protein P4L84_10040 [Isosphaeraceae bacterium]|nr:hypothetical protein [Isosphaeraceae bacterium]
MFTTSAALWFGVHLDNTVFVLATGQTLRTEQTSILDWKQSGKELRCSRLEFDKLGRGDASVRFAWRQCRFAAD